MEIVWLNEMVRKIYWILISFLFLALVAFGLAYKYGGLKDHISYVKYLSHLTDPSEKKEKTEMFFTETDPEVYGGILSYATAKGLWVWGRKGLKYFSIDAKTHLITFENCAGRQNGKIFKSVFHKDFKDWKRLAKVGNHIFVYHSRNDKSLSLFDRAYALEVDPDFNLNTFSLCSTAVSAKK